MTICRGFFFCCVITITLTSSCRTVAKREANIINVNLAVNDIEQKLRALCDDTKWSIERDGDYLTVRSKFMIADAVPSGTGPGMTYTHDIIVYPAKCKYGHGQFESERSASNWVPVWFDIVFNPVHTKIEMANRYKKLMDSGFANAFYSKDKIPFVIQRSLPRYLGGGQFEDSPELRDVMYMQYLVDSLFIHFGDVYY